MFVDNKLLIHFGDDKSNSILIASKQRAKNIRELYVRYKEINIKQQTYVGCVLDEPGEPTTLKFANKINGKLKFV